MKYQQIDDQRKPIDQTRIKYPREVSLQTQLN